MNEANREQQLVRELLSEELSDEVRARSLRQMLDASRRRSSQRRVVRHVGASLALLAFSLLLFIESKPKQELGVNSVVASMLDERVIDGTPIRVMTDEDLFALFPNQSVGVVGVGEEFQLVFLDRQGPDSRSLSGSSTD